MSNFGKLAWKRLVGLTFWNEPRNHNPVWDIKQKQIRKQKRAISKVFNSNDLLFCRYKLEIAGGLGPTVGKVWRIGLMGENAKPEKVDYALRILKEAIDHVKQG